jgi:hypothetical protein
MITQIVRASSPVVAHSRFAGRVRRRPERPRAPGCSVERLEALDAELARRAGEAGRQRFEMGRGLDSLERIGGDHALGFSSIEAYALERCERSASWTQKARGLARRLDGLPPLADTLISGSLSWSMAAVLATVAGPDDAEFWLAEAARRTLREMKALVLEQRGAVDENEILEAEEELRTLTLTVPREDAWCFEQAKLLGRHLGEGTNAGILFGLVAESTSTLCSELPSGAIELADDSAMEPQRSWEGELARMRTEGEVRCESHFRRSREALPYLDRLHWPELPEAIDAKLRELARELASREVAFGRALDAFFSADGWRRLGYASAAQYARERLGTSLSSVKAKRWLAKRLGELRLLADALERGELGYEAARLVARVATRATVEAWVTRATERTLRHLREEIDAAELLASWSEGASVLPPSNAEVQRVEDLERAVVTGQVSAPPLSAPSRVRPAQHELSALCLRALRRRLASAPFGSGLRAHLPTRSLSLPEPLLWAPRRHAASPPIPLSRRRRLGRERDQPLHVVPPRGHSSRTDLCNSPIGSIEHSLDVWAQRTHRGRGPAACSMSRQGWYRRFGTRRCAFHAAACRICLARCRQCWPPCTRQA